MLGRIVVGVLVLLPSAAAATLDLTTGDPIALDGQVTVGFTDAAYVALDAEGAGTYRATGVTGNVHVWTQRWERTFPGGVRLERPLDDAREEVVPLADGDLALALDDGADLVLVGALNVHGATVSHGAPVIIAVRAGPTGAGSTPEPLRRDTPDHVEWAWEPGHVVVGAVPALKVEGWPRLAEVTLVAEGPFELEARRGLLTLGDRAVTLGSTVEEEIGIPGTPAYRAVVRVVSAIVDASIGHLEGAPEGDWGLAGATPHWKIDGRAAWTRASGTWQDGGREESFQDAPVLAEGALSLALPVDGVGEERHVARGEMTLVRIGGRPVETAATEPSTAVGVAAGAGALALFALLPRAFAAFYTRVAPSEALRNETRRALYDAVLAEPGVHKRSLQRRLDVSWGTFTFHLRVLETAGYVREERLGQYVSLFPVGDGPAGPVFHHPVARAVYDLLPVDGSPVTFAELRRQVGVSAELLRYHLRSLETKGLARRIVTRPGPGMAARVTGPGLAATGKA